VVLDAQASDVPSAHTTSPDRPGRVRSQSSASHPIAYAAVASMSAQVRSPATTVTDATPAGARPVTPCTTWWPRWAAPEVATAPVCTGTTASTRVGSCGSSMPIRQGSPAGSRTTQVRSPPPDRQTSVSSQLGQRAQRALQGPSLHDAVGVEAGARAAYVEGAAGCPPGLLAQGEHFDHLARAVRDVELTAPEPGQDGVGAEPAEHAVRLPEHRERIPPRHVRTGAGGVPAAQGEADRQAHHHLDPPMHPRAGERGHSPAWSRALCSDWR
jgi:hypothetical protein